MKANWFVTLLAMILALLSMPRWVHAQVGSPSKALLLFGGEDHKTFLGCLNCSDKSADSVCNQYGTYGSKYSADSIWNEYGTYGSKYSNNSPWDQYSNEAPIIVDEDGNSYGHFSANQYHPDRTHIKPLVRLLDAEAKEDDLKVAHALLCSDGE